MFRQITRIALFSLAALPAAAQVPPAAVQAEPPVAAPEPATVRVLLETGEGPIALALETERAPITTANFLRYVDEGKIEGTSFYRASRIKGAPQLGLIQGGVRGDPERSLPPVEHEPTTNTGLSHMDGTISMARGAPGTATGDFFITVGDMPSMDANPTQPGDNLGFAAFGHVVDGMDAVRQILGAPTSPTEGEGVMRGEMIAEPVKIIAACRAAPSQTSCGT